jgi:hypothetical protein
LSPKLDFATIAASLDSYPRLARPLSSLPFTLEEPFRDLSSQFSDCTQQSTRLRSYRVPRPALNRTPSYSVKCARSPAAGLTNDAIEITWLRDYLNFSLSRPTWAKVTDLTLRAAAPPGTSTLARTNSFLQSWNPPTRGQRLTILNNDTIRMLKAGRKYHTNLAAICLSPDLRGHLPAWYHLKAAAHPLTTRVAKCLLETHSVATVADLITTSARLRNNRQIIPHTPTPQCMCNDCTNDRDKGCSHPHECAADALA